MTRTKNAWKVVWIEEGKKRSKWFEGDPGLAELRGVEPIEKPLEAAVAFGKEMKSKGLTPELISARKAFIQRKDQPRQAGKTWCPYCVKWREFRLLRIKRKDFLGVAAYRCPVCTVSDSDYYVRKYNGKLEHLTNEEIRRYHDRAQRRAKSARPQ